MTPQNESKLSHEHKVWCDWFMNRICNCHCPTPLEREQEAQISSLQNKLKMAEKVLKDTKEAFIFWNKQIKSGTKILEFYLPKELDEALTAIKSEEGV